MEQVNYQCFIIDSFSQRKFHLKEMLNQSRTKTYTLLNTHKHSRKTTKIVSFYMTRDKRQSSPSVRTEKVRKSDTNEMCQPNQTNKSCIQHISERKNWQIRFFFMTSTHCWRQFLCYFGKAIALFTFYLTSLIHYFQCLNEFESK